MKWNEAKKLLDEGKAIRHKGWMATKKWQQNKDGMLICMTPYHLSEKIFVCHYVGIEELKWARRCSSWEVVDED